MEGICDCNKVVSLKVEADMGADPLWCAICNYNLDIEDIELPDQLTADLFAWVNDFASWVDWETDTLIEDQEAVEAAHNERGLQLTEIVKETLKGQYEVIFSPSKMY